MTAASTAATPTSLTELLEQHAQAAVHISGAEQTAWSGRVVEAGEGILGLAHWDGTLHLDRECILNPLQEMYDRSGYPHSDADLIRYREALVTLLHEQSHFLGPVGATQEAARAAFKVAGSRHLEEGVAEAWAHDHLNDYIRHLGIDKVAPGITTVRSEPSYAAFVPAVRLLTSDIDRQADLPRGETLQRLNRQTAEHQWLVAVDLIYRSSRLPQVVPPDQQPGVRFHLEKALRTSFQALETYEPFPRGFASSRSHSAGTRILTLLHNELDTATTHFSPTPSSTSTHLATTRSANPTPSQSSPSQTSPSHLKPHQPKAPAPNATVPAAQTPEAALREQPAREEAMRGEVLRGEVTREEPVREEVIHGTGLPKPSHQDPQAAFHQALSGLAPPTPGNHQPRPTAKPLIPHDAVRTPHTPTTAPPPVSSPQTPTDSPPPIPTTSPAPAPSAITEETPPDTSHTPAAPAPPIPAPADDPGPPGPPVNQRRVPRNTPSTADQGQAR